MKNYKVECDSDLPRYILAPCVEDAVRKYIMNSQQACSSWDDDWVFTVTAPGGEIIKYNVWFEFSLDLQFAEPDED